jgi:hypothetical protein
VNSHSSNCAGQGLLQPIDEALHRYPTAQCRRCGIRVPRELALRLPGPFCDACIADVYASAESFGGTIGDVALRHNAGLLAFLDPVPPHLYSRALHGENVWR